MPWLIPEVWHVVRCRTATTFCWVFVYNYPPVQWHEPNGLLFGNAEEQLRDVSDQLGLELAL